MNQEHNETTNSDQQGGPPHLPKQSKELDPNEFPAPIYNDGIKPSGIEQRPLPAAIKAANRTSKVVLFISFGILAVILLALLVFYF